LETEQEQESKLKLISISPNSIVRPAAGSADATVTITFDYTYHGDTPADVADSLTARALVVGTGVTFSNFDRKTQKAILTITPNATLGAHAIGIVTDNLNSNTLNFTVNPAPGDVAPTLSSITPTSHSEGGNAFAVQLTGANFVIGGTTVVDAGPIRATNVQVVSTTQINAVFTLLLGNPGPQDVIVRTRNGSSNPVTFTVTGGTGAPVLDSVTPNYFSDPYPRNMTLTGVNFVQGAVITISPADFDVRNVHVVSPTEITAVFDLFDTDHSPGPHTVKVTPPNGTSNTQVITVL